MIRNILILSLMLIISFMGFIFFTLFIKWRSFNQGSETPNLPWKSLSKIIAIAPEKWVYISAIYCSTQYHLYYKYEKTPMGKWKKYKLD